ncbi:MAG: hypothetical protein ACPHK8_02185 [Thermoplasmatota archaeon]
MRKAFLLTTTLLVLAFAGCVGGDGTLAAKSAMNDANSNARDEIGAPLLGGALAIEGNFDMERALELIEEEAEQNDDPILKEFLDTFNLLVYNGEIGDGKTGSWFTAHVSMTSGSILISQVFDTGDIATMVIPAEMFSQEAEPEFETTLPALPLASLVPMDAIAPKLANLVPSMTQQAAPGECRPVSTLDEYNVDSPEATDIAMGVEAFAAHVAENPQAEFIYLTVPGFGAENCGEFGDFSSDPMTFILNMDLDELLFNGTIPTDQYVVVNARTGEVEESGSVLTQFMGPTILYSGFAVFQDPMLAPLGTKDDVIDFEVPREGQASVSLEIMQTMPGALRDIEVKAVGPEGEIPLGSAGGLVDLGNSYQFEAYFPVTEGDWSIVITHETLVPNNNWMYYLHAELF